MSKTYFSHLDISRGSPHLLSLGKKIVLALAEGSKDISQLTLLSHCMLVALSCHMRDDFTAVAHAAMDKYLSAFAAVLAEKYR
ncbi:hypothetical protein F7725_014023 [Dissostichus mawsoni]|uniref:Globin domain-containing protein n=1 Tax=Dissostichus mawsoni TaxID=36200 RepID=A0A7J5YV14_DISMA|nr:hypothetical protein F7725_014023 [Dissostichus mawsoni]